MPYDLFISYARRDNESRNNGDRRVSQLVERIGCDFESFARRTLRVFFDENDIQGMDDWRQKIQQSLRESHLFLAVLSPGYVASPYCRWEWEDYVRYEAMRQCLGEGVAPVFFVTLPDAADAKTDQAIAGWIKEIQDRQTFDLRPWYDVGEDALQQAHVKSTLEELQNSVRERLDRFERARRSPDNLIKHNPAFVGRVHELTELRNALVLNKLGVIGAREGQVPGRATVQGLGGMGKTELALAYAHTFAWDYPGGRWQVGCERIGDLRVALLQLAGPLKFEFTQDENESIGLGFDRVLRELNRRERCLLVLDNVSDPSILEPEYLDRLPRDGRMDLIATTRLAPRSIPGSAQAQTFIVVGELPAEDALALLRSHQPQGRFPNQEEDDHAREIVRVLDGFTLAVETAGIYLGRYVGKVTCAQFLGDLRTRLLEQSEEAAGDSTVVVRHRERLLEKTLAFTLDTLSPEALHLLNLAALLPADSIALPWLQTVGGEEFPVFNDNPEGTNATFPQTVELLLALRLFQTAGETNVGGRLLVVRMHRLVQAIVNGRSGGRRAGWKLVWRNLLHRFLNLRRMKIALPEVVKRGFAERNQLLEDRLINHAGRRCIFLVEGWLNSNNRWEIEHLRVFSEALLAREGGLAALIADSVGKRLFDLAQHAEAEPLMRQALVLAERSNKEGRANVPMYLRHLALLLKTTNRLDEAETLIRRALKIDERNYGPKHPTVARDLNDLAMLLVEKERLAEAEPLMRRALAIDEEIYGEEHVAIAHDLNDLATLLRARNRLAEAEPLIRHALMIDERYYGPKHHKLALGLNNLAALLQATNRLTEAEPLMRRVVNIMEQTYAMDHPYTAMALSNLATLLHDTNRWAEAEPLMRRALAIDEQIFGPEHPDIATKLNNLAALLKVTNRLLEEEPLIRRSLAIHEMSYGHQDRRVVEDLDRLAQLLEATNRPAEAESVLRRALAINEQVHGPNHEAVAATANKLAALMTNTHRAADAESLMRRALAIHEVSQGLDHPRVAEDLSQLGALLLATNRLEEAEPLIRRALAIEEKNYGWRRPNAVVGCNNLAALLLVTNRLEEAEPLIRRALAVAERIYGPEHTEVSTILNNLAKLLQSTNRLAEAESLMRRALAIDEQSYGPEHPELATELENLATLLKATNRLVEAEPLIRRRVEIVMKFIVAAEHGHPELQTTVANYADLLQQMGRSEQEIQARLDAVGRPYGIQFGGEQDGRPVLAGPEI